MNLLESVKSAAVVQKSLEAKTLDLLKYIRKLKVSNQQLQQIEELIQSFPTRNNSQIFLHFNEVLVNILKYLSSENYDDVAQGISLLLESFGNSSSLEEQFELLKYLTGINDMVISKKNNKDFKDIFHQVQFFT
jgi:hypothetical protein